MKTITTWSTKITLLFSAAVCVIASPAKGEIGLGEIWGTAWTIGNEIVGTTTLTPAYSVNYWYSRDRESLTNGFVQTDWVRRAKQDLVTKTYFYSDTLKLGNSAPTTSTQPFPINSVDRVNFRRVSQSTGGITTALADHTVRVWLAKVEHTGYWPDNGPWTVWVKTRGNSMKVGTNGMDIINGPEKNYWVSASLQESGSQTVKIGAPSCHLEYPYFLGNDFY